MPTHAEERHRGAARQPQPPHARQLRRHASSKRRTSIASRAARCSSTTTSSVRCRACRRATTCCAARSTFRGSRGARSSCGKNRSRNRCAAPASRRCSSPIIRTSSKTVARTTTPSFARGSICAATKAIRGRRAPIRRPIGAPTLPAAKGRGAPYDLSRTWFREELDFPGPRTMSTAANWLRDNAGAHDRFMLFIDEFDPHEPFDTPAPWANRYDPDVARRADHLAAVRDRRGEARRHHAARGAITSAPTTARSSA